MFGAKRKEELFFNELCEKYYNKVLQYLFARHRDEGAAKDCAQEVFLTAYGKKALLMQHPNPGGFLFQTAKNLSKKMFRESCARMEREILLENGGNELADSRSVEEILDSEIDAESHMEQVLEQLTKEKRELYTLYYTRQKPMREIAKMYGVEETAMRMRFVRLRKEIRDGVRKVAEHYFSG